MSKPADIDMVDVESPMNETQGENEAPPQMSVQYDQPTSASPQSSAQDEADEPMPDENSGDISAADSEMAVDDEEQMPLDQSLTVQYNQNGPASTPSAPTLDQILVPEKSLKRPAEERLAKSTAVRQKRAADARQHKYDAAAARQPKYAAAVARQQKSAVAAVHQQKKSGEFLHWSVEKNAIEEAELINAGSTNDCLPDKTIGTTALESKGAQAIINATPKKLTKVVTLPQQKSVDHDALAEAEPLDAGAASEAQPSLTDEPAVQSKAEGAGDAPVESTDAGVQSHVPLVESAALTSEVPSLPVEDTSDHRSVSSPADEVKSAEEAADNVADKKEAEAQVKLAFNPSATDEMAALTNDLATKMRVKRENLKPDEADVFALLVDRFSDSMSIGTLSRDKHLADKAESARQQGRATGTDIFRTRDINAKDEAHTPASTTKSHAPSRDDIRVSADGCVEVTDDEGVKKARKAWRFALLSAFDLCTEPGIRKLIVKAYHEKADEANQRRRRRLLRIENPEQVQSYYDQCRASRRLMRGTENRFRRTLEGLMKMDNAGMKRISAREWGPLESVEQHNKADFDYIVNGIQKVDSDTDVEVHDHVLAIVKKNRDRQAKQSLDKSSRTKARAEDNTKVSRDSISKAKPKPHTSGMMSARHPGRTPRMHVPRRFPYPSVSKPLPSPATPEHVAGKTDPSKPSSGSSANKPQPLTALEKLMEEELPKKAPDAYSHVLARSSQAALINRAKPGSPMRKPLTPNSRAILERHRTSTKGIR
ncbi:MAG: hypothetical protein M1828_003176 [Chrysothrix sp. TS-e1954]|nr:MAG: hypothetical protein M1828_003176 [Chrysothrix sp. TS-e1954]